MFGEFRNFVYLCNVKIQFLLLTRKCQDSSESYNLKPGRLVWFAPLFNRFCDSVVCLVRLSRAVCHCVADDGQPLPWSGKALSASREIVGVQYLSAKSDRGDGRGSCAVGIPSHTLANFHHQVGSGSRLLVADDGRYESRVKSRIFVVV